MNKSRSAEHHELAEHADFVSEIETFAHSLQNPDGTKRNQSWRDDWQECAAAGLLALNTDAKYGGKGLSVAASVAALEAFGYGCTDNGLAIAINGQTWAVQNPIEAFGSDDQRARYLPGLCDGTLLGAHALTEAETGSDAMSARTTAEQRNDGYVLNGSKVYIGMGPECDVALVFASTAPQKKQWGLSAFLVEAGDQGFERGAAQEKMGLQSTPFGTLNFNDCWIPKGRRLGAEGAGMGIFNHTLEWERCFIFSSHTGAMRRQLDACVEYARTRKVFDRQIIDNQSVSNRLADMKVRLETSRLLLQRAAELKDQGIAASMEAAIAKLHISEAFLASSIDAVRIHGGKGYLSDTPMERDLRDSMGGVIYSGTSDIQRQIISRLL